MDARHRQLTGTQVGEAVSRSRESDHDIAGARGQPAVVQLEVGLSGVEDEYLRVRVAMELP